MRSAAILAFAFIALAAQALDASLPAYQPERDVAGEVSAAGDESMRPLMEAWLAELQKREPGLRPGAQWQFVKGGSPFGALMFETADVSALARAPVASELAPYAHQFAGDMMKSPLLVRVAGSADSPAYLAVNKRPDSPLPPKVKEFLSFALSREGQALVEKDGSFGPLTSREAAVERARIQGFLATLDPELPHYRPSWRVSGEIASVGSDGMKTLMDRWMRDFRSLQPGVRKGERWEHLGTLNGFHALIAGETDIAPMGRELWPAEAAVYEATFGFAAPLEIRVARGGFNTPQRTTAQAIFVNERNPVTRISVPQLAAILGAAPTITRWGQLGATGEWAGRPISIYTPPRVAPNAMSMQMMVLEGGNWNPAIREGSIAQTANAIARDENAIGFGGLEEGGPGLKALAVAYGEQGPFFELDAANASGGRYPLTRYLYIRLNLRPGEKPAAHVREFLRYILSRAGQEPILYSGYFPLTAQEAKEELAKLD